MQVSKVVGAFAGLGVLVFAFTAANISRIQGKKPNNMIGYQGSIVTGSRNNVSYLANTETGFRQAQFTGKLGGIDDCWVVQSFDGTPNPKLISTCTKDGGMLPAVFERNRDYTGNERVFADARSIMKGLDELRDQFPPSYLP